MSDPAYGRFRPALWWAGLQDRLQGRSVRARARWGRLRPPPGFGPLVWLRTGGAREDVQVAVALMQALREARDDTRLVLTYHSEYRDVLEAGLRGLRDMGFGYGPCDAGRAVRRVLARLDPAWVVTVGEAPPANLGRYLARRDRPAIPYGCLGVDGDEAPRGRADPLTLLTPAQVEPTLGGLLRAGGGAGLWWWHGPVERDLLRLWAEKGREHLLVVSGEAGWAAAIQGAGLPSLPLSAWDREREAVPPGTVLVADEARWYPALAASVDAVHLAGAPRALAWQALAGGRPLSFSGICEVPLAEAGAQPIDDVASLWDRWQAWRADPFVARAVGDRSRRFFWDCRRRAREGTDRLLERYRRL